MTRKWFNEKSKIFGPYEKLIKYSSRECINFFRITTHPQLQLNPIRPIFFPPLLNIDNTFGRRNSLLVNVISHNDDQTWHCTIRVLCASTVLSLNQQSSADKEKSTVETERIPYRRVALLLCWCQLRPSDRLWRGYIQPQPHRQGITCKMKRLRYRKSIVIESHDEERPIDCELRFDVLWNG